MSKSKLIKRLNNIVFTYSNVRDDLHRAANSQREMLRERKMSETNPLIMGLTSRAAGIDEVIKAIERMLRENLDE